MFIPVFHLCGFKIPCRFGKGIRLKYYATTELFGVIFSSRPDDKWILTLNAKREWTLRNNKNIIESGSILIPDNQLKIKIKKEKNQFEFEIEDNAIVTTSIPEIRGHYFGFQVENNDQRSAWVIQKYKLKTF